MRQRHPIYSHQLKTTQRAVEGAEELQGWEFGSNTSSTNNFTKFTALLVRF
jgi:hypothetical protein